MRSETVLTFLSFVALLCAVTAARGASPQTTDARQERLKAAVARVYDARVLHRIDIVIAPEDASKVASRTSDRVRCTFTFDGVTLKDVGVRQAGGSFNRFVSIDEKPTLSLKFDDFVNGQELHGLEKMVLKDGRQDSGFVGEHLTYDVYRRAGIAANGQPTTGSAQRRS